MSLFTSLTFLPHSIALQNQRLILNQLIICWQCWDLIVRNHYSLHLVCGSHLSNYLSFGILGLSVASSSTIVQNILSRFEDANHPKLGTAGSLEINRRKVGKLRPRPLSLPWQIVLIHAEVSDL